MKQTKTNLNEKNVAEWERKYVGRGNLRFDSWRALEGDEDIFGGERDVH